MNSIPKPYEVYRHFKGNFYQILAIAIHSETREKMVVYQQLYSPFKVYVRPLEMFMEPVDRKKYPEAKQEFRFEKQDTLRNALNDGLYPEYRKQDEKQDLNNIEKTTKRTESVEQKAEETSLHPKLIQFLDADSYEEKLSILSDLHREISDEMINTIAVSLDLEVKEGELEDRYKEVLNCLITLEKFECNRLR